MKITEAYKQKLRFRNYSERTIETYSCYLDKFLIELNIKDPYQISLKQIKFYLENREYSSISVQNQVIGSLKLFARYILNKKDLHLDKIERPKRVKKIPRVIDAELLAAKINAITNIKHKSILTLGLSCGLRISEVINLKWENLDRIRNTLTVINGKGRKDRTTILNDNLIELLTNYWIEYRTKEYIFEGQFKSQYSQSSIQNIVKKYIHRKASFHLCRHSYATFALDNGTELAPLSKSLGHSNTKTTEIYYHTSVRSLNTIKQAI